MLAESACIVEACLSIPVSASPFAFAVRDRPCNVFLTENFLTVNDGCNICHTCTVAILAVLLSCVLRVVRSLCLEREALGKEAHVELVLDIEVECICALVYISEVIIVGKRITVILTDDVLISNDMTSLLVHSDSGIRSCTLEVTEEETLTATHCGTVLHTATESEVELAVFRDVDIEVSTIVQTLIVECLVLVLRECLEERVLVEETG